MSIEVNGAGRSYADALIKAGKVDRGAWSFDAADGNALLGPQGNHWSEYARYFLALDTEAAEETKDRYKYPFGKDGKLYVAALRAIRTRASQQGAKAVFDAAGKLLDATKAGDADGDESEAKSAAPAGQERRIRPAGLRIERRDSAGGGKARSIVGHAAVFDQWTTMYDGTYYTAREVVRPGAFARAIREKQDVRALFNHDPNFILGRMKSGTLRLSEDRAGLLSEIDAPDTQTVNDLVVSPIERGDMDGMSFGFVARRSAKTTITRTADATVIDRGGDRITIRQEGDKEVEERELLDVDLLDVSPVCDPQYDGTDVALRGGPADADFLAHCRERDIPRESRGSNPLAPGNAARARLLKTLAAE
jgi:HK97 family phage prohead protease